MHPTLSSTPQGYEAWLHSLRANSPVDIFYNDQWISATVIGLTQDDMGSLSLIVRYAPMDVNHEEHGIAYIQPEKEFVLPYMSMYVPPSPAHALGLVALHSIIPHPLSTIF